jgi:ABC-type multidrug transport system ATPase subunit
METAAVDSASRAATGPVGVAPPTAFAAIANRTAGLLVLSEVEKRWDRRGPAVLDRVSLTLAPGTLTRVGGSNGAGKTTMLRIAAGLIEPDRGHVEVDGTRPYADRMRYQRLVAFLPAGDRGLYARLSVRRHLEFWARISMLGRRAVRPAVEHALDQFELRALADRRVDRMSMGQRQRLRLAMTFLPDPTLVLLDEPLTSLDDDGAGVLERALRRLVDRGGAGLWCSPGEERTSLGFDVSLALLQGKLVHA